MDGQRFDRLASAVVTGARSRRGLLRLVLVAGVGGGVAASLPEEALACRKDGRNCRRDGQCCSGSCKKGANNGQGACKRARSALGCTVKQDICREANGDETTPCPGRPDGFCVRLNSGRPFCARGGGCEQCQTDGDCTRLAGGTPGHCVTSCRPCQNESNGRACVYARLPEDDDPVENLVSGRALATLNTPAPA